MDKCFKVVFIPDNLYGSGSFHVLNFSVLNAKLFQTIPSPLPGLGLKLIPYFMFFPAACRNCINEFENVYLDKIPAFQSFAT